MTRLEEIVISLWNKGVMPEGIAEELSVEREIVECIIEDKDNYPE